MGRRCNAPSTLCIGTFALVIASDFEELKGGPDDKSPPGSSLTGGLERRGRWRAVAARVAAHMATSAGAYSLFLWWAAKENNYALESLSGHKMLAVGR